MCQINEKVPRIGSRQNKTAINLAEQRRKLEKGFKEILPQLIKFPETTTISLTTKELYYLSHSRCITSIGRNKAFELYLGKATIPELLSRSKKAKSPHIREQLTEAINNSIQSVTTFEDAKSLYRLCKDYLEYEETAVNKMYKAIEKLFEESRYSMEHPERCDVGGHYQSEMEDLKKKISFLTSYCSPYITNEMNDQIQTWIASLDLSLSKIGCRKNWIKTFEGGPCCPPFLVIK